jgi:hypothetical protein
MGSNSGLAPTGNARLPACLPAHGPALLPMQDDDNMKEALRYSAALLGELRTSLLRCGGRSSGKQEQQQAAAAAAAVDRSRSNMLEGSGRQWRLAGWHARLKCATNICRSPQPKCPANCCPAFGPAAPRSITSCTCRLVMSCAIWRQVWLLPQQHCFSTHALLSLCCRPSLRALLCCRQRRFLWPL